MLTRGSLHDVDEASLLRRLLHPCMALDENNFRLIATLLLLRIRSRHFLLLSAALVILDHSLWLTCSSLGIIKSIAFKNIRPEQQISSVKCVEFYVQYCYVINRQSK